MKDTFTYSLCKICHNGKFSHTCKVVELTEQQIQWTIEILEATKYVIDCETYRNKLKEILE